MQIDAFTVLLFGLFIKVVLGALFIVFWIDDRRSRWFLWWSASFFLGGLTAALFMLRRDAPDILAVGLGNMALFACFACAWQGARVFDGREPLWSPVVVVPATWFAFSLFPTFLADIGLRVIVSSLMAGPLIAMSAVEFWRGRTEALRSRWPLVAMFSLLALFFLIRIPLVNVLPFPFGALPMRPGWLGAFNLIIFSHVIIITVLIVSMTKERLELDQRMKALTDPLTGALNRRAFSERGERLLRRHERENVSLCLAVLDLDRFKAFNDDHGHAGGDRVLTRFVSVVHDCIRPTDLLFRLGGEEFCCLLSHTNLERGAGVAERIRQTVQEQCVNLAGDGARVTVSIGVASTELCGFEIDALLHQADLALYEAKRQGRNRVITAAATDGDDEPVQDGISILRAKGLAPDVAAQ